MKLVWVGIGILFLIAAGIWLGHDYLQKKADIHNPDSPIGRKIDESTPLQYVRQYSDVKRRLSNLEMVQIRNAIVLYQTKFERDPETIEELVSSGCIGEGAVQDAFRQDYRLRRIEGRWALMSSGTDQILNTSDDVVMYLDGVMTAAPAPKPTEPKPEGRNLSWYDVPAVPTRGAAPAGP